MTSYDILHSVAFLWAYACSAMRRFDNDLDSVRFWRAVMVAHRSVLMTHVFHLTPQQRKDLGQVVRDELKRNARRK